MQWAPQYQLTVVPCTTLYHLKGEFLHLHDQHKHSSVQIWVLVYSKMLPIHSNFCFSNASSISLVLQVRMVHIVLGMSLFSVNFWLLYLACQAPHLARSLVLAIPQDVLRLEGILTSSWCQTHSTYKSVHLVVLSVQKWCFSLDRWRCWLCGAMLSFRLTEEKYEYLYVQLGFVRYWTLLFLWAISISKQQFWFQETEKQIFLVHLWLPQWQACSYYTWMGRQHPVAAAPNQKLVLGHGCSLVQHGNVHTEWHILLYITHMGSVFACMHATLKRLALFMPYYYNQHNF